MSMKENALYIGFDFYNIRLTGDIAKTLQAEGGGGGVNEGCVLCLNDQVRAQEHGHQPIVLENHPTDGRLKYAKDNVFQTLLSRMGTGGNNVPMVMEKNMDAIVRRLTPLECERLQGYPDGWTDIGEWTDSKGKKHKDADSPRYKALGNSIALPFWEWMAQRICNQYDRPVEMASLFDGIGGFPLVFSRCGGKPIWASEIEEFPMAVTKIRFKEEE